jgi:aspartate oxidase
LVTILLAVTAWSVKEVYSNNITRVTNAKTEASDKANEAKQDAADARALAVKALEKGAARDVSIARVETRLDAVQDSLKKLDQNSIDIKRSLDRLIQLQLESKNK